MSDYSPDIKKYTKNVDDAAVQAIVKYCGIALRNKDSATVAGTDPSELATVRDGFAAKKLGLPADVAELAIAKVVEMMKGDRSKSRVTFYYLLADVTGTLNLLR